MSNDKVTFKSFIPPGLVIINGVKYVVPGWHVVPMETTLEEVERNWIKESAPNTSNNDVIQEKRKIIEYVTSSKTGEKYRVMFDGRIWSCTCVGFGFRKHCKHIEEVKKKYNHSLTKL